MNSVVLAMWSDEARPHFLLDSCARPSLTDYALNIVLLFVWRECMLVEQGGK